MIYENREFIKKMFIELHTETYTQLCKHFSSVCTDFGWRKINHEVFRETDSYTKAVRRQLKRSHPCLINHEYKEWTSQ